MNFNNICIIAFYLDNNIVNNIYSTQENVEHENNYHISHDNVNNLAIESYQLTAIAGN